jgi:diguanylate cyclase (GGDEF)-like protein
VSILLIAAYPLLPPSARTADFLAVSWSTVPAVGYGLRQVAAADRRPWWLLLAALAVLNIGNVVGLLPAGPAGAAVAGMALAEVLAAAGDALVLVAAVTLVVRRGRNDVGGLIDTVIVAWAAGGLLWDILLLPHLTGGTLDRLSLFVTVFVLSGVLGALGRLAQLARPPVPALWLFAAALGLALTGYLLAVLLPGRWTHVVTGMLFMGGYAALGRFGLDPSARRLARPDPMPRDDALSPGRLAFLGVALAAVPVVGGGRALLGAPVDGLLLAVGGAALTPLVVLRIARLSAERARAERALLHQATHDPLTGLANRREFAARLAAELTRPASCVVLFCDLDEFKAVNDRLGHVAGDRLLVEVARRLRGCVRDTDLVSRFGGDEFLVMFRDATLAGVEALCARIAAALAQPVDLGRESVAIGASIGLAVGLGDVDAAEELISRADRAMSVAKRQRPDVPEVRMVSTGHRHARG